MGRGAKKARGSNSKTGRTAADKPAKVSRAVVVDPADRARRESPLLPPNVAEWLRQWGSVLGIGLFLVAATFAVYGQALRFQFVSYDDNICVYENRHVKEGLTPDGLQWAFTSIHTASWRPLAWLSHMLDWSLFGSWAGGHHLVNLLLHAASSVVLFLALRRLTGATWRSGLVAALFCLHPLHVESVAWISQRTGLLGGLFFGLTLWAYAEYAMQPFSWGRYALVVALFALGLLCTPILVTLPFVLLLLDFWPLARKLAGRTLLEKLPLFALSAAGCVVTYLVRSSAGTIPDVANAPWLRLQTVVLGYAGYVKMFVWPFDLAVFYPPNQELNVATLALGGLAIVAISAVVLIACRRRCRCLLVGWFWFLGMLVPVGGAALLGDQFMADRYTYLPLTGLLIALVWGAAELAGCSEWDVGSGKWKVGNELKPEEGRIAPSPPAPLPKGEGGLGAAVVGWTFAALVLLFCTARSFNQASNWSTSSALFQHALDVTRDNYVCHAYYGGVLANEDKDGAAEDHLREALGIHPGYYRALCTHGELELKRGDLSKASESFHQAIESRHNFAPAHKGLAMVYGAQGRFADEERESLDALRIDPDYYQAEAPLADALMGQRRVEEAAAHYRSAIEATPDNADLRVRLALSLLQLGSIEDAIAEIKTAIDLKPDDVGPRHELAKIYHTLNRPQEAFDQWKEILSRQPNNAKAAKGVGMVLVSKRRFADAVPYLHFVLSAEPRDVDARNCLALAYIYSSRPRDGVDHLRETLRRDPNNLTAINTLAWLDATHPDAKFRDGKEAVELARKAEALKESWRPQVLDTLAAAYAESGQFKEAAETAREAKKAADAAKRPIEGIDQRIKLYDDGKPYRDPMFGK